MKRILISLTLALAMFASFTVEAATSIYLGLYKCQKNENPEDPKKDPNRRIPSAPLHCTISETGIEFPASFNQEILYYEITDSEENIYTFGDEASFISTLFTLSGEITIVIATPQYLYLGGVIL